MAITTKTAGFYANEIEVFFVTPAGRAWIVSSPDFDGIREIDPADLPSDAGEIDHSLTPEEYFEYLEQVEAEGGEALLETD